MMESLQEVEDALVGREDGEEVIPGWREQRRSQESRVFGTGQSKSDELALLAKLEEANRSGVKSCVD